MMRKSIVTIDILENAVHPVPNIIREAALFLFLLYWVGKESRERHRKIQSVNLISVSSFYTDDSPHSPMPDISDSSCCVILRIARLSFIFSPMFMVQYVAYLMAKIKNK
jgi:hypothetical protein